jgi:hypothetical protein
LAERDFFCYRYKSVPEEKTMQLMANREVHSNGFMLTRVAEVRDVLEKSLAGSVVSIECGQSHALGKGRLERVEKILSR